MVVGEVCTANTMQMDDYGYFIYVTGYTDTLENCTTCTAFGYDDETQCCFAEAIVKNDSHKEYNAIPALDSSNLPYGTACPTEPFSIQCEYPYFDIPGDGITPYCEYEDGGRTIYIGLDQTCEGCSTEPCKEDSEETIYICADNATSQKIKTYMNDNGLKYDISSDNCAATTAYAGRPGSVTENPERFQRNGKVMWKDGLCEFVYLDEWGCAPGYQKRGGSIGTEMPDFICVPCSANQYYDENTQSCKSCPTAFISPATNNTGTVTLSIKECYIYSGSGNTAIKLTDSLGSIFLHEEIGENVKLYHVGK